MTGIDKNQVPVREVVPAGQYVSRKITTEKGNLNGRVVIKTVTGFTLGEKIKRIFTLRWNGLFKTTTYTTPLTATLLSGGRHLLNPEDKKTYAIALRILSDPNSKTAYNTLNIIAEMRGINNDVRLGILSQKNYSLSEEGINQCANNVDALIALIALIRLPTTTFDQENQIYKLISNLNSSNIQKLLDLFIPPKASELTIDQEESILLAIAENNNLPTDKVDSIINHVTEEYAQEEEMYPRVLIALSKRGNLNKEQFNKIFTLVGNTQTSEIAPLYIGRILQTLVENNKVPPSQFKKILYLVKNGDSGLDPKQQSNLLLCLSKSNKLSLGRATLIFNLVKGSSSLDSNQKSEILGALAKQLHINPPLARKIFSFVTKENSFNDNQKGTVFQGLTTNRLLNKKNFSKIFAFATSATTLLRSDQRAPLLQSLSTNSMLTPDNIRTMIDLAIGNTLGLTPSHRSNLLESLSTNSNLTPDQVSTMVDIAIGNTLELTPSHRSNLLESLSRHIDFSENNHFRSMFDIAKNGESGLSPYQQSSLLEALAQNPHLTKAQFTEMANFATTNDTRTDEYSRDSILQALSTNKSFITYLDDETNLEEDTRRKIIDFATTNNPGFELDDTSRNALLGALDISADIITLLDSKDKPSKKQFDLMINFALHSSRKFDILQLIAQNPKLTPDNIRVMANIIKKNHSPKNKNILLALAANESFLTYLNENTDLSKIPLKEIFDLVTTSTTIEIRAKILAALSTSESFIYHLEKLDLPETQFNKIFDLVATNTTIKNPKLRAKILLSLAKNNKLNPKQLKKIFDQALTSKPGLDLDDAPRSAILEALARNRQLDPKLLKKMSEAYTNDKMNMRLEFEIAVISALALRKDLPTSQLNSIFTIALDKDMNLTKEQKATLFRSLARNPNLKPTKLNEIFELALKTTKDQSGPLSINGRDEVLGVLDKNLPFLSYLIKKEGSFSGILEFLKDGIVKAPMDIDHILGAVAKNIHLNSSQLKKMLALVLKTNEDKTKGSDKLQRAIILQSIAKNLWFTPYLKGPDFDLDSFDDILKFAKDNLTGNSKMESLMILNALAQNSKLDKRQLGDIFNIIKEVQTSSAISQNGIEIWKNLIANDSFSTEQLLETFAFIMAPPFNITHNQAETLSRALVANNKFTDYLEHADFSADSLTEILSFVQSMRPMLDNPYIETVLVSLAKNNKLTDSQLGTILNMVIKVSKGYLRPYVGDLLAALVKNNKLGDDNLHMIFDLVITNNSRLDETQLEEILGTIFIPNDPDPEELPQKDTLERIFRQNKFISYIIDNYSNNDFIIDQLHISQRSIKGIPRANLKSFLEAIRISPVYNRVKENLDTLEPTQEAYIPEENDASLTGFSISSGGTPDPELSSPQTPPYEEEVAAVGEQDSESLSESFYSSPDLLSESDDYLSALEEPDPNAIPLEE